VHSKLSKHNYSCVTKKQLQINPIIKQQTKVYQKFSKSIESNHKTEYLSIKDKMNDMIVVNLA
jgi:hypothetical protein